MRLRGNRGLGVAVIAFSVLVALQAVASAALAPAAARAFDEVGPDSFSAPIVAYDLLQGGVILLVPAWILTSLWLAVARDNAAQLAPRAMHRKPVWVWLGWVVPIVWLYFPKQIVDDVLEVTDRQAGRRGLATWPWWTAWLVFMFGDRLYATVRSFGLDPAETAGVHPDVDLFNAVAGVIALGLWIHVVLRVSAAQEAWAGTDPTAMVAGEA